MNITFDAYDKFQRKPFAERLTKAITTFHRFSDGAYVLSLNAKFGSGKTTFLEMWKNDLERQDFQVVYLNAWETDFDEDPIIPLISCLLESLKTGAKTEKVKSALKGALGATALIGNKFLEQATGIDVYETMKGVEHDLKASDLKEIGSELYKSYGFKLKAYQHLKEALLEYVNSLEKKPLIILVDELDRVRPDYSVKFLEAVKHLFSVQGICFVLAVDRGQLECSVKQLYGNVDFDNYYRRFVTREAVLPSSSSVELNGFIQQLGTEYFDRKTAQGVEFCFAPQLKDRILGQMIDICKIFEFTPRQIQYLFRIFVHFTAIEGSDRRVSRETWFYAIILMIAIQIHNESIYHRLGSGEMMANDLNNYLLNLNYPVNNSNSKRYTLFNALAFNLREDDDMNDQLTAQIIAEFDNRAIMPDNIESAYAEIIRMLARTINDFGECYAESSFRIIYKNLENWRSLMDG